MISGLIKRHCNKEVIKGLFDIFYDFEKYENLDCVLQ